SVRAVDRRGGRVSNRACGIGEAAHRRQHTPDVGVLDDRRHAVAVVSGRGALATFAGESDRVLAGALGDRDALQRDRQTPAVHHGEHAGEPAIFLAEQLRARRRRRRRSSCRSGSRGSRACARGVAELANEFSLTSQGIRFYEESGLISPARVGRTRVFNYQDRARLILIQRLRRLGFSIDAIREYLSLYKADVTGATQYRRGLERITERIRELESKRRDLDETLARPRAREPRAHERPHP